MRLVSFSLSVLVSALVALSLAACGGSGGAGGGDVAPAVMGFMGTPPSVVAGEPTDVTWSWTHAGAPSPAPACTIDHGVGAVTPGAVSSVSVAADTVFTLTCANAAGSSTGTATIHATPAAVPPVIASFTASPSPIVAGVPTAVTWTWTFANAPTPAPTCTIDGGVGTVASGASTSITLSADTTFTLTCANGAGTDTAQASITVTPPPQAPVIASFTASPASVTSGVATSVVWTWTFAAAPWPLPTCTIDGGVGPLGSGDSVSVTLSADTTFTITCTSDAGTATAEATIAVPPPQAPQLTSFTASPSSVTSGVATDVVWSFGYATPPSPAPDCTIDHGIGAVSSGATSRLTLSSTTVYTLTCTNVAGSDTAQVTVTSTAAPVPPNLLSFTPVPGTLVQDVPTSVTWNWTYLSAPSPAPTCTIEPGVGEVARGGTTSLTLSTATTFTLTCTNAAGSRTAQAPIAVVPQVAPQLATFTVTPDAVPVDVPTVVRWRYTFATSPRPAPTCTLTPGNTPIDILNDKTTVSLASDTDFSVTCTSVAGSDMRSLTLAVRPPWVLQDAACGTYHTCAVAPTGAVWCWGAAGLLGDWLGSASTTPMAVSAVSSGATAIATGLFHTCAVLEDGTVRCWGDNSDGQLGDGGVTDFRVPVTVAGISSALPVVAAGWSHTCVALAEGGVRCWGNGGWGQLGNGSTSDSAVPVAVSGITARVIALSAGSDHTCAVLEDGSVWCWGYNGYGELGIGTTNPVYSAVPVASPISSGATVVTSGLQSSCAVVSGGVKCWGINGSGQLGDGTTTSRSLPVDAIGLSSGVLDVRMGAGHACALMTGGGVKCWGYNAYGQLGDGTTSSNLTARDVPALVSGVAGITAGTSYACAWLSEGGMQCWGANADGVLGDGTKTNRTVPTWVSGL